MRRRRKAAIASASPTELRLRRQNHRVRAEPGEARRRRGDPRRCEARSAKAVEDVVAVVAKREDALWPQLIVVIDGRIEMLDDAVAKACALDRVRARVQRY